VSILKKNSKIYVAGHNGFVGKNLYSRLLQSGYTNIYTYNRNELDLTDTDAVNSLFIKENFEYVFMCAAKCGGLQANLDDPYSFLYDNLTIQNNIIHASIASHVKKVIFLGSSCIYPTDYIQPLKEEYILKGPVEPTNEGYSIAKIAGLKLCEYANKLRGQTHNGIYHTTSFISLMPCNLYGPEDDFDLRNSHVMAALIRRFVEAVKNNTNDVILWGTGEARREFLFIDDLSSCMIWAMKNLNDTETFLNVGTGIDVSIKELANLIAKYTGFKGNILFDPDRPEGMKRKCLDVTKINRLGWEYSTTLENGILKTIDYYIGLNNE
jgi:GDP-L-fucose synthase